MTKAGYFIRPCDESRGWVIRSLRTRKLVVTRNVYVVKDANTRHAQLALSDDLAARHGSLGTTPDDYRDAVRKLFASHLDLPASSALVIDDPLSGVPVALMPALEADHEHVSLAPSFATSVAALPCCVHSLPPSMRARCASYQPDFLLRASSTTYARPSESLPVRRCRASCPATCGARAALAPTRTRVVIRTGSSFASW